MTKKKIATDILVAHYLGSFKEHGANSDGVDWGSREKHHLRLRGIIEKIGPNNLVDGGIIDVGCGYAELLLVLNKSFGISPNKYIGIDPCHPMIDVASEIYPEYSFEAIAFEDYHSKEVLDHLVCCGVFTKKMHATSEDMYALLDNFFMQAKNNKVRTITFNTMSPLCDIRPSDLFFPDMDLIIELIRKYWGYKLKKFSFEVEYLRYEMLIHLSI